MDLAIWKYRDLTKLYFQDPGTRVAHCGHFWTLKRLFLGEQDIPVLELATAPVCHSLAFATVGSPGTRVDHCEHFPALPPHQLLQLLLSHKLCRHVRQRIMDIFMQVIRDSLWLQFHRREGEKIK